MAPARIGLRAFGLSAAAVVAVELALAEALGAGWLQPMAALGGARAIEIFALLGIFQRWGGGLDRIGLLWESLLPGIVRGLWWSGGAGILAAAAFLLLFLFGIHPLTLMPIGLPREMPARVALYVVGGGLGPVAEEIFFRGILYGYLRRWGMVPAMLVSTAVFAMMHTAAGVTQVVGGILFAAAYEAEGSLAAPITIHVLGNLALFSLPVLLPLTGQW
mgnify:CR=1 FL=1